jgi:hypothetical protein
VCLRELEHDNSGYPCSQYTITRLIVLKRRQDLYAMISELANNENLFLPLEKYCQGTQLGMEAITWVTPRKSSCTVTFGS